MFTFKHFILPNFHCLTFSAIWRKCTRMIKEDLFRRFLKWYCTFIQSQSYVYISWNLFATKQVFPCIYKLTYCYVEKAFFQPKALESKICLTRAWLKDTNCATLELAPILFNRVTETRKRIIRSSSSHSFLAAEGCCH